MTLTHAPQTIHQGESGLTRLRAHLHQSVGGAENRTDLVLYTENFDDSADPELGEDSWYMDDVIGLTSVQVLAAKTAIDTYLLQTGIVQGVSIEPIDIPDLNGPNTLWSALHRFADGDDDLIVEQTKAPETDAPCWKISDRWGEKIFLTPSMLSWLNRILPAIERSYDRTKELAA